ncbi:MAG: HAMP domain-containing histidine kinase [Pseudomonadales bacterium]|nr:HAMP domain-containing histidine kinase [Pseudomonadales bacterium]
MLKKVAEFFQVVIFNNNIFLIGVLNIINLKNQIPKYSLVKSKIFFHACSTPLTILLSNLEFALDDESNVHIKQKSSLEAAKKLAKIINSVSGDVNKNERFCVMDSINEVFCLWNPRINNCNIDCKYFSDNEIYLIGNKLYFQEALSCILNNAFQAYKNKLHKPINLIVRKEDNNLKIDFVDFACGMNLITQKLALIDGLSFRKNGQGIGLHFVKKTIEEIFSGKMSIQSSPGFGTHITWIIPLTKPYNQNPLQS